MNFFSYQKSSCEFSDAPLTIYNVKHRLRYRFRVMNAASNVCPFMLQIENHEFTVIASDGASLKPVTVDTLYFIAGERYDIVVQANREEVRDYWLRIRALPPCTKEIEEFAILRYHKNVPQSAVNFDFDRRKPPGWLETFPDGRFYNTPKPGVYGIPISEAESNVNDKKLIEAVPDYTFKLFIGTPQLDNEVLFSGNDTIKFMGELKFAQKNQIYFENIFSHISQSKLQQRWSDQQYQPHPSELFASLSTQRHRRENFL